MPAVVNDRCLMVQTVQKTVEIYGLDHGDFTVAVQLNYGRCPCCVRRAGSTVAFVVETAEIPQLQVVEHSSLYGGGGEDEVFRPFYGPFSHSVHLDVECRVVGTPGACSQVFCHPIRCISGATLARHGAFVII